MDDKNVMEKVANAEDGGFLKPHIFTLTIPQVTKPLIHSIMFICEIRVTPTIFIIIRVNTPPPPHCMKGETHRSMWR